MLRIVASMALCGAGLLVGGAASKAESPARSLAGRYYRQFADGLVSGETYTGQDIVEIVPVAGDAAYVRAHLDFYNGHSCSIARIAQSEGARLLYRSSRSDDACALSVGRAGRSLRLDDNGGTCKAYCGARGSFSDVSLPWSSKRPIRYLTRLKASPQYQSALAEWKKGHQ